MPMLAMIAADLHADAAAIGWIPTLSFGGMLLGAIFLVPLGDRVDKHRLVMYKIVILTLAQATMIVAPNVTVLALASLVSGICSSLSQSFISITAEMADPNHRGRALGTQLTAMFTGLMFARLVGGIIATHWGWRYTYVFSTGLLLCITPVLWSHLPHTRPTTRQPYWALIGSLWTLFRVQGGIRRAAAIQFLFGICYGGFWAVASPMLLLIHGVGAATAGLMGIPGAAGISVTRFAGRWTDRVGLKPVVFTGIVSMLAAWVVMAFGIWSIIALVLGAILLDCGLRISMVANQTLVNSAVPLARSRANTIFGAHVWCGNAVGAFLTSLAFAQWGWLAVCMVAMSAIVMAMLIHLGVLPIGIEQKILKQDEAPHNES